MNKATKIRLLMKKAILAGEKIKYMKDHIEEMSKEEQDERLNEIMKLKEEIEELKRKI